MDRKRDIVNVIFKISQLVKSITDEEFEELEAMAQEQCDYQNPLKCATTSRLNDLGKYNRESIRLLKEYKRLILSGARYFE